MKSLRQLLLIPAVLLSALALVSCGDTEEQNLGGAGSQEVSTEKPGDPAAKGKPVVQATNYPLAYFAQRIAGDKINLQYLPPTDGDPAFWEPTDQDVAALQQADLILLNGATYAKWLDHVSLPSEIQVDTSQSFATKFIEIKDATTHSHGPEGDHSHAGTAFTTWMDMTQAKKQAEAVRTALSNLLPDDQATFQSNAAKLFADLEELDAEFMEVAKKIGEKPLVASHPVYQYFARRYQLNIKAVLWEPETVPNDKAMEELKAILKDHPAKWMIWEGEPVPESVKKLQDLGVQSLVVEPVGNKPEAGDWLSVMHQNVENLKSAEAKVGAGQ